VWTPSAGATYYRYCLQEGPILSQQLCNGLNWEAPNSKFVNTTETKIVASLKSNTLYNWQVRAYNNNGESVFADGIGNWFTFTTGSYPGAFQKSIPNGATNVATKVRLAWTASQYATYYQYCINEGVSASLDKTCQGTAPTTTSLGFDMSLKPNTEYEWQVRAYNDAGDYIPADGFRMWHSFKTGNYPGPFKKTNPVAGSTNQPLSIKLAWSSTTNAQTYAYCVDDDLSNLLCHGGTEDNFTPIKATEAWVNVLPGRTYRWQVRAYNANGEATPADGLEQWWQFTTQPTTGGFAKIEPPNGVTMYPANSILRWQESQGADSYEYCIDQ